jgi:hypothetical protein
MTLEAVFALLKLAQKLPAVIELMKSGIPAIAEPATVCFHEILARLPAKPDGTPWTMDDVEQLVDIANQPLAQVFAIYGDTLPPAA